MIKTRWSRPRQKLPDNLLHADEALYIAELQRYLRGIPLESGQPRAIGIDGIYGEETRAAVADFQRMVGLQPTGRVDRATWDVIFAEYELNRRRREALEARQRQ